MFKFATERPTLPIVWNVIVKNKGITAKEGFSVDQVRFYIYLTLVLEDDFSKTKTDLNSKISTPNLFSMASVTARVHTLVEAKFNINITVSFPMYDIKIFEGTPAPEGLHTVAILTRFLLIASAPGGAVTGFIAAVLGVGSGNEMQGILKDLDIDSKYLTKFKLYSLKNELLRYVMFDKNLPSIELPSTSEESVLEGMREYISMHCHIGRDTLKVVIPEFKLAILPPEEIPALFAIGDTVRLAPDMRVGKEYSHITYLSDHTFLGTTEVKTISTENNITRIKINDNDLWYSPEMLELVGKGN